MNQNHPDPNRILEKFSSSILMPIIGVALAITIASLMDGNGLTNFSALPLFPLMGIFWFLERYSKKEIDFTLGRLSDYLSARVYPVTTVALITVLAFIGDACS